MNNVKIESSSYSAYYVQHYNILKSLVASLTLVLLFTYFKKTNFPRDLFF